MDWLKKVESNKSTAVWGFGILFGIVLPLFSDKFRLIHRVWMVGFFCSWLICFLVFGSVNI